MTPPRAILFDLDGTLIDTISLYARAVIETFAERGHTLSLEEFRKIYNNNWHIRDILARFGHGEEAIPDYRARRDARYRALLRAESTWLPGAKELLEEVRLRKIPTAIITGSWMNYVDEIDANLGIKEYFPIIITADDIHKFMKPHPHGLLLAADRLGINPLHCTYVGDQAFDAEAAKRAGMKAVLVRGEWSPGFTEGASDLELEKEELKDLLQRLSSLLGQ